MNERSNASETSVDLMRDPHAPTALNELARASAVANDVSGLLWVLRYTDVERLAIDRRLHGVRLTIFDLMGITEGPLRRWYGSLMFTNEGDQHGRLRRLVIAAFKPKAVNALRAATRAMVEQRFGELRRDGGGDLVRAFQYVPMRVMCALLGVRRKMFRFSERGQMPSVQSSCSCRPNRSTRRPMPSESCSAISMSSWIGDAVSQMTTSSPR
jgi:cytochrome P450